MPSFSPSTPSTSHHHSDIAFFPRRRSQFNENVQPAKGSSIKTEEYSKRIHLRVFRWNEEKGSFVFLSPVHGQRFPAGLSYFIWGRKIDKPSEVNAYFVLRELYLFARISGQGELYLKQWGIRSVLFRNYILMFMLKRKLFPFVQGYLLNVEKYLPFPRTYTESISTTCVILFTCVFSYS